MSLFTLITGHRPALQVVQRLPALPRTASPNPQRAMPVLHRGGAPAQLLLPLGPTR